MLLFASLPWGVCFHAVCAVMALGWVSASLLDSFQPACCLEGEVVCLLPLPEAEPTPEHRCNKHDPHHPLKAMVVLKKMHQGWSE